MLKRKREEGKESTPQQNRKQVKEKKSIPQVPLFPEGSYASVVSSLHALSGNQERFFADAPAAGVSSDAIFLESALSDAELLDAAWIGASLSTAAWPDANLSDAKEQRTPLFIPSAVRILRPEDAEMAAMTAKIGDLRSKLLASREKSGKMVEMIDGLSLQVKQNIFRWSQPVETATKLLAVLEESFKKREKISPAIIEKADDLMNYLRGVIKSNNLNSSSSSSSSALDVSSPSEHSDLNQSRGYGI